MEINPFHNGHKYFLQQVRKRYPNAFVIVAISTTISQRGEITVLSKVNKTKILLDNNVDLVIEMPIVATNQGGHFFALETVKALDLLNVDLLIFGSESNDKDMLNCLDVKKGDFKEGINKNLKDIKSNDILGISYIQAIKELKSNMEFELIKREGADYNSNKLSEGIISATAIRNNYSEDIRNFMPKQSFENMFLVNQENLINLLKVNLINLKDYEKIFLSENGELINKIKKNINTDFNTLMELAQNCSDKNNSKYKFMRLFINIMFDIRNEDKKTLEKNNKYKVLGFNNKYSKFIKGNEKLFLSYKEDVEIYKVNDRIDKILNIYYPDFIDFNDNYKKPIIK